MRSTSLVTALAIALLVTGCSSAGDHSAAADPDDGAGDDRELSERLDGLESEVSDLRQELLGDDGGPRIDELDARLAALIEDLEGFETALAAERQARDAGEGEHDEAIQSVRGRAERLEASVRDTASAVQEVRGTVDQLRRDLGDLESRHNLLEERFSNQRGR